jgi:hypothetical protein
MAPVIDGHEAVTRPRSVQVALWLFWMALAIGILVWSHGWREMNEGMISPARYFGALISFGIEVWLYLKIRQGRNWARITVLVITLVRAVAVYAPIAMVWRLHYYMDRTSFFALIIGQILIYTALYLVFVPGREWFRRARTGS